MTLSKRLPLDRPSTFARARNQLKRVSRSPALIEAIGPETEWAIVGGAVRDLCLVHSEVRSVASWNDLDIAVLSQLSQLPATSETSIRRAFQVTFNTYGGLKMSVPGAGAVDIWHWSLKTPLSGTAGWRHLLGRVDFSINAISYVPALNTVLAHPAWRQAAEHRIIEFLNSRATYPELRVVRALALCAALNESTRAEWTFGPRLRSALRWFFRRASNAQRERASRYIRKKLAERRWPRSTMQLYEDAKRATAGAGVTN